MFLAQHSGLPPASVCATIITIMVGVICWTSQQPQPLKQREVVAFPKRLLCLRCAFVLVVVATLTWSLIALSHIKVCDDTGELCMAFKGAIQFTTFTRWCWMLEGLYFFCAILSQLGVTGSRTTQLLFSVSLASAVLVTTVTYGVLVPGVLFTPQPVHRQGHVEILFSTQGHIMHSLNLSFMLIDAMFSKRLMYQQDLIWGVSWCLTYVCFEWWYHFVTGQWHYPFLDFNKSFAPASYAALQLTFIGYWFACCLLTSFLSTGKKHFA